MKTDRCGAIFSRRNSRGESSASCFLPVFWLHGLCFVAQSQDPIPKDELKMIQARYAAQEKAASARLRKNPDDLSALSARGDARLFLGTSKVPVKIMKK